MKDRRQSQSFQAQLLFEKSEDNAYPHKVKSAKGTKILEKVLYLYKSLSHTSVSLYTPYKFPSPWFGVIHINILPSYSE